MNLTNRKKTPAKLFFWAVRSSAILKTTIPLKKPKITPHNTNAAETLYILCCVWVVCVCFCAGGVGGGWGGLEEGVGVFQYENQEKAEKEQGIRKGTSTRTESKCDRCKRRWARVHSDTNAGQKHSAVEMRRRYPKQRRESAKFDQQNARERGVGPKAIH